MAEIKSDLKDHLYILILCGGGGTRLWPSSRKKTPKQFINLLGKETIFSQTIKRAKSLVPEERIFVVTNSDYVDEVLAQGKISLKNIIAEPQKRNTALAMAAGAAVIAKIDPKAVIVNLASDHLISPIDDFVKDMKTAASLAQEGNWLVTVGLKPTFPHSGLGYIKVDEEFKKMNGKTIFKVKQFKEKPNLKTAKEFIKSDKYFWNANLYTWGANSFLEACKKHAPKIYEGVKKIQAAWNESEEDEVIEDVYKNAESISIDYAISEKADNLLLVPASFNWSDIGDWKVVFEVGKKDKEGNVVVKTGKKGELYNINSNNNLIRFEDRLVALIDVEGLVVVDTKDALLICKKDKAQHVKELVNILKEKNKKEYL